MQVITVVIYINSKKRLQIKTINFNFFYVFSETISFHGWFRIAGVAFHPTFFATYLLNLFDITSNEVYTSEYELKAIRRL
jgi:hypothetical protein